MNRIEQSARRPEVMPLAQTWDLSSGQFSTKTRGVPHALFAPQHYEAAYAYPLIVWLHGPADDERQLLRIMPLVSMRNYVAVAPRGVAVDQMDSRQAQWLLSGSTASQAEQLVLDSIEMTKSKYHISPRRIFVAGFDTGGTMAFRLAMNHPDRFAGVLSFGGAFPVGQKPLAHLQKARRLSVFLAAGRDSTCYSPEQVCDDLRLLHSAGLSITLRQYPCRQELSPQMLRDMDRWIIEQITQEAE